MTLDSPWLHALALIAGVLAATLASACFYRLSPRQHWSDMALTGPAKRRLTWAGLSALLGSCAALGAVLGAVVGTLVALCAFMTVQMAVPVLVVLCQSLVPGTVLGARRRAR
ncbi:MAG: hypothetical protein ACOZE7_08210 [Pseudomonadota bacterium]